MKSKQPDCYFGLLLGQRLDMARGYLENYFHQISPVDSLHNMVLVLVVLDRSCQQNCSPVDKMSSRHPFDVYRLLNSMHVVNTLTEI